jgi:hypothetical protein
VILSEISLADFHVWPQQEMALRNMKKELEERPTENLLDDLRKKVKILQVNFI